MDRSAFLEKAAALLPKLQVQKVRPLGEWKGAGIEKNGALILDFGNHFVGSLTISFGFRGNHIDAPVLLTVQFAERLVEFDEDTEAYRGWISKSWIQTERVHLDELPTVLELRRRYAFRYVKLTALELGAKTTLTAEDCFCLETTSANELTPFDCPDTELLRIDAVTCRTLRSCMQEVFEDGPKRDRRLWLGDLRLQALTNSVTYRNYDLVKRCLYLFAGCAEADGRVPSCVYTAPQAESGHGVLFDYALLFAVTLLDYAKVTGDLITTRELLPCAVRQFEASQAFFREDVVEDSDNIAWCFIDWTLTLNKQTAAQGVYLYSLKALLNLFGLFDMDGAHWRADYTNKALAARRAFWDPEKGLFLSGKDKQLSWASQVWMILGGVIEGEEALQLLQRLEHKPDAIPMVTPYLYHYYLEALLLLGQRQKAEDVIRTYWGGMIRQGADTFWELYDPNDAKASPYGGTIVNSYCHAWSCTPSWFLRSGQLRIEKR